MIEKPIDWTTEAINVRDLNRITEPRQEVPVDKEVSRILGFPVKTNDMRLIRFVAQWKREHGLGIDGESMDFLMRNDDFIKALKKAFNG